MNIFDKSVASKMYFLKYISYQPSGIGDISISSSGYQSLNLFISVISVIRMRDMDNPNVSVLQKRYINNYKFL